LTLGFLTLGLSTLGLLAPDDCGGARRRKCVRVSTRHCRQDNFGDEKLLDDIVPDGTKRTLARGCCRTERHFACARPLSVAAKDFVTQFASGRRTIR
jgi:hypothetical protein